MWLSYGFRIGSDRDMSDIGYPTDIFSSIRISIFLKNIQNQQQQQVLCKVCEMRGAPKPTSTAELRIASECEPMTDMRGSAPTAECRARWSKPEPDDAEMRYEDLLLDESFAAPLALAAMALYA